jgi:hypothetical protein
MRKKSLFVIFAVTVAVAVVIAGIEWMSSAAREDRAFAEALRLRPKAYAACSHMILLLDSAKSQWAMKNRKTTNDPPPTLEDLHPFIGQGPNGDLPKCPCGGTYILGRLDEHARCSLPPQEHTWELWDRYSKPITPVGAGNSK